MAKNKNTVTVAVEIVKFICPAGQASPSPPVGPVLGSRGLKAIDFVKEFNARTAKYTPGIPMQVEMVVQRGARQFTFDVKTPPVSWLLLRAAGVEKGSSAPGKETVGKNLSLKHVYEIAKIKQQVVIVLSLLMVGSVTERIAFTFDCKDDITYG